LLRNKIVQTQSIVVLLPLLWFFACKQAGPVEPRNPKDPRTYTWQKDSVGDGSYPIFPSGIWASTPSDVYLVAFSGGSLFTGKMWHYDGTSWTDFTPKYVEAFPAQQIFPFQAEAIYGFGKNDVWIVGSKDTSSTRLQTRKGFVMHFDGSTWQGFSASNMLGLLTVWGASSSDMWAGGWNGALYHYNGSSWQEFSFGDTTIVEILHGVSSTEVYVSIFSHNNAIPNSFISIHKWNGLVWSRIESTENSGLFDIPFAIADGVIYSANGSRVTKRVAPGVWEVAFQDPTVTFWGIWASSSTNIFAIGGYFGETVYHYNGRDSYRFRQFTDPTITYSRMWGGNEEVFIAGESHSASYRAYILHGK
jgi:hypothetical protein